MTGRKTRAPAAPPGDEVRILLADDHDLTRRGLRPVIESMPGWIVCGEANTGFEAVEMAAKLKPSIVIMDVTMPEMNGLDATRRIKIDHPEIEVVIFTGHETEKLVREVFDAGARSFLLKTARREEIEKALRIVEQHRYYFTTEVGEMLFAGMVRPHRRVAEGPAEERLSDRERQIVQTLAEGGSNKDGAGKLDISIKTVETHRSTIMKKLHLKKFSDMVRYAVRNQIVSA